MTEMRILTVRQPWAWAIIHGGKDVENRVRNIAGDYRGPVAIHAGLAFDREAHTSPALREAQDCAAVADGAEVYPGGYTWEIGAPDPRRAWSIKGAIIGVVDLVDAHSHSSVSGCIDSNARSHMRADVCSSWGERNVTHLMLANPRPLADPIPYRGALGLRHLDDTTTAQILAQIGDPR